MRTSELTSSVFQPSPGTPTSKATAATAQADQELLDDAVLADDDLAELSRQCAHGAVQFGNHRFLPQAGINGLHCKLARR